MKNIEQTFYYSRQKLGIYLIFNILLLSLAILFTLSIFPEYPAIYYFATGSCLLSAICALVVFLIPLRLAIITTKSIKIDRAEPLKWSNVKKVKKIKIGKGFFCKNILKIETVKLKNYHFNIMQKLTYDSDFGAFSIPLYAMSDKKAKEIEKLIRKRIADQKSVKNI